MIKILYIEDDPEIADWVKEDLMNRGYEVIWLSSGEGALSYISDVQIVILDIMLKGLDGFTVGQRLKREFPSLPIILLSARSAIEDKLEGLSFADDYMTKPFHPDELAIRLEVLLRRFQLDLDQSFLTAGHLQIHQQEKRVVHRKTGEEIVLTGKEFQILDYFLQHPNQILTKEQVYEAIWNEPYLDGDKALMVHIRHLRQKIEEDPANPTILETIRGLGYRVKV